MLERPFLRLTLPACSLPLPLVGPCLVLSSARPFSGVMSFWDPHHLCPAFLEN